jgi:branched-chain amino acid transport system permease protein
LSLPIITLFGINLVSFSLGLGAFFGIYAIVGLSLNLELGYTGIPDFGKVLYFAGGAAVGGAFSGEFALWLLHAGPLSQFFTNNTPLMGRVSIILQGNTPFSIELLLLTLLVAAATGAFLGFLTSYPAIRLREDFLGMSLFAISIFFLVIMDNYTPLVGGPNGIQVPNVFAWAGDYSSVASLVTIGIVTLGVYLYLERMVRSPLGRTLRAMRDNEESTKAQGKDIVRNRINVLVISSAITGVAGALYVFYSGVVLPETVGNWIPWTVYPWLIVIWGGRANNLGVILGAFVYELFTKALDIAKSAFSSIVPFSVVWVYYLIFAVIIVAVLNLRPGGMIAEKPTATLGKSRLRHILDPFIAREDEPSPIESESPEEQSGS